MICLFIYLVSYGVDVVFQKIFGFEIIMFNFILTKKNILDNSP